MSTATPHPAPDAVHERVARGRRTHAEVTRRHPLLLPLVGLHAALVFAWLFLRHRHFASPTFDLGAYHSVLWNLAFRATPWNSIDRAHQMATHLEPGLLVLVPFYRLLASPVWLWLAESLSCAALALPVDALARRVTGDRVVGLLAAAATLVTPQLALGELADFHGLALCALPIAMMAWSIAVDSSRGLVLSALGAMALREQMGVVVAAAAVAWFVHQGKRRLPPAIALAVVAFSVSMLEIFVVIPSFGSAGSAHFTQSYAPLGGNVGEAARNVARHPFRTALIALDASRGSYLLALASGALPLVLFALRRPRLAAWPLLLALPPLAIQLIASSPAKWDIHHPYGIPVVPLFATAAVLAIGTVPCDKLPSARRWAAAGWLTLTLFHMAHVMPSPVGPGRAVDRSFEGSARAAALARGLSAIPDDATVSAQDNLVPHLATRSEVHCWPDGWKMDDYVFLDQEGPARNMKSSLPVTGWARRLRADPHLEVLIDEAGVILAKRVQR